MKGHGGEVKHHATVHHPAKSMTELHCWLSNPLCVTTGLLCLVVGIGATANSPMEDAQRGIQIGGVQMDVRGKSGAGINGPFFGAP